jgi:hypothetical protein
MKTTTSEVLLLLFNLLAYSCYFAMAKIIDKSIHIQSKLGGIIA